MRETYKNEMSKVHAPKELIEKTKLAMHQEMEIVKAERSDDIKQHEGKTKKNHTWMRYASITATAVAATIIIMLVPALKSNTVPDSSGSAQPDLIQSELMLEQLEFTPNKITPGTSEKNRVETFIVEQYPDEFLSDVVAKKEIEEIPVQFVKDEKTGFYKAAFTWKSDKILVTSQLIEMEQMIEAVKEVIQKLSAQTED